MPDTRGFAACGTEPFAGSSTTNPRAAPACSPCPRSHLTPRVSARLRWITWDPAFPRTSRKPIGNTCGQIELCSPSGVYLPALESGSGLSCFVCAQHGQCPAGAGHCAGQVRQSRAGSGTGGALPTHHGEREQSSDSDQTRGKSHSDVAGGRSRGKASPWVGVRVQISTGMAVTKGAGPRSRATPEDEGRSSQPGVLQLCPFRAVTAAVPRAQAAALLGCNRLTESRACGHLHM